MKAIDEDLLVLKEILEDRNRECENSAFKRDSDYSGHVLGRASVDLLGPYTILLLHQEYMNRFFGIVRIRNRAIELTFSDQIYVLEWLSLGD
jgi:hypothetical protein